MWREHLQLKMLWTGRDKQMLYRWALPNGWHCGHWHSSLDAASDCLLEHTYDA